MFGLTGLAGRIATALLYGFIVFIVVFIIGIIIATFSSEAGDLLKRYAALIGLLAGLVTFLTGSRP